MLVVLCRIEPRRGDTRAENSSFGAERFGENAMKLMTGVDSQITLE